jgi:hypothetical protein
MGKKAGGFSTAFRRFAKSMCDNPAATAALLWSVISMRVSWCTPAFAGDC